MTPAIVNSIKSGFKITNRSWAGMGVFALSWAILGLLTFALIFAMNVPAELSEPSTAAQVSVTNFGLDNGIVLTPAQEEIIRLEEEERSRIALEWLGNVWPLLLLWTLVLLAASVLIIGGQIGYLASAIRGEPTSLAKFWESAKKSFKPLILSWLLVLGISLGFALFMVIFGLILSILPPILAGVLGFLFLIGLLVGMIWVVVKIAFWSIAIVIKGLGPVESLKSTFQLSNKRWWKTLGLLALLAFISMACALPINLLSTFGGLIGGGVEAALNLISGLLEFAVVNVYIGFVAMASLIRYYLDIVSSQEISTE